MNEQNNYDINRNTQLTFTCSQPTKEALKMVWNISKVNNKTPEQCQWPHSGVFC